jgi:hypothetical protein
VKLLFVVGTGRCGSTLVHEVLARHRDAGFISNIDDNLPFLDLKGRWNNSLFRSPLGRFTTKGRLRFAPSEGYQLIARQISPLYAYSCRDLTADDVMPWVRDRFRRFFEQRQTAQAKPIFLHKYTGWSRLGFFTNIFPEAKFVHIVRNGKAVASSWLKMDWWDGYRGPERWLWGPLPAAYQDEWLDSGRSFVRLSGICWKMLLDSYESGRKALAAPSYLEVRYEDLVEDPATKFREIAEFGELSWDDDFERAVRSYRFVTDSNRAYERDLSPSQLHELQAALAQKLAAYGYEQ